MDERRNDNFWNSDYESAQTSLQRLKNILVYRSTIIKIQPSIWDSFDTNTPDD